ncbi:MAG: PASTA domain-containing protein [Butyricicoccaceae bacterium]
MVDFTGKSLDYVAASLDAHGIELKEEEEYSDDVEEGKVIRTDPEAGTELARGETLTVYISLGKEQKSADVPSLTGMTQEAAQRALSERGLSLGSVDQVESDKPEGTVVWQSIDANSSVNQGTTVNIQISRAKRPTSRSRTAARPAATPVRARTTRRADFRPHRRKEARPFR